MISEQVQECAKEQNDEERCRKMHRDDPEGETRMEKWLKWAIEIQNPACP